MELLPQYQHDLSAMNLLYIRSNTGALVPLSAVARITQTAGALTREPLGTAAVGDAVVQPAAGRRARPGDRRSAEDRRAKTLPASISTGFSGTAQAFQSTQAGMLALLGIAIFVIYVVLGVLYESFIHPITILSGLPFAAFGALLTLLDLQDRPERLRVRRHHPARRPREEERDHDDRLRARGRAQRRDARRRTRSCTRA